jgi:hypothetical protein
MCDKYIAYMQPWKTVPWIGPLHISLALSLSSFPALELFCSRDNCMMRCLSSMHCGLINADERAAGQGYKQQAGCEVVQILSYLTYIGLLHAVLV